MTLSIHMKSWQMGAEHRTQKERAMKSQFMKCVAIGLLATGATCICWSKDSTEVASIKAPDVQRLMNSAATPEEFAAVESYFDQRARLFDQKAAAEDAELKRLSEQTFRAKNYPVQFDRASQERRL